MSSSNKKPVSIKQESRAEKNRCRGGRRFLNTQCNTISNKFKGKTDKLEEHFYNIGVANQSQLFANTTKEVAEYAGQNLKESQDIRLSIEQVDDVTFNIPTNCAETGGLNAKVVNIIYKTELDNYIKCTNQYRQNKSSMYAIVFGQCYKSMRAKIEGDAKFNSIKANSDVIQLLKLIRDITFNIESD